MKYLALICVALIICSFKPRSRFKKFPKDFDNVDSLIRFVTPGKNYTYWAFCQGPASEFNSIVVFSNGTKPDSIKFKSARTGLFGGCEPIVCFNYIEYIDNGKVGYITTPAEFKEFLGSIDNLQEAVLLAKSQYYLDIDDKNRKGGSFILENGIYKLRLVRYHLCPDTKESIEVTIDRSDGNSKTLSRGTYYKSKQCTVI